MGKRLRRFLGLLIAGSRAWYNPGKQRNTSHCASLGLKGRGIHSTYRTRARVDVRDLSHPARTVPGMASQQDGFPELQADAGASIMPRQACCLWSVGTQAAVRRASVTHLGLELQRQRTRLVEPDTVHVHLGVAVDQRLELAVRATALAQIHLVVADVHLRVDDDLAHRADRLRELDEHLARRLTRVSN